MIEAPRYRWSPGDRWNRLAARLREDRGIGLVELLIALLVLNIGIFATLAAFTSGAVAINRASHVSTAAALADQQIEKFRDMQYVNIPTSSGSQSVVGPDGRQYTVAWAPSSTYSGSVNVKGLTVTVSDISDTNQSTEVLYTSGSTFSQCAQNMTNSSCGG